MGFALRRYSLLSCSASLASSDSVETLLDVLARPRSIAHLALQVEQTGTRVPRHVGLDALATEAAHILFDIPLVETINHRALVATLQKDVGLAAEITLDIHLSFEVFEHVDTVTIELLAQHIKVYD